MHGRSRARPATTSSCRWLRLGRWSGARRFVEPESVHRALAVLLGSKRPEMVAADIAAFDAGYEAGLEEVIA